MTTRQVSLYLEISNLLRLDRDSELIAISHLTSIQALLATDPADDMHMIANKKDKLLDTIESWIIKDSTYTKWLQDGRSLVLWLHGDPGKGKTMLAIALIEEFSTKLRLDPSVNDTALVYFFCDNQDDRVLYEAPAGPICE